MFHPYQIRIPLTSLIEDGDDDYYFCWENLPEKLVRGEFELHNLNCDTKCKENLCIDDDYEVSFALI